MKKIIFFSYHSLTVLKDYYDVLSKHNDCWWLVYNEKVYDEIVLLGYKKVVLKGQRSNKLFQTYQKHIRLAEAIDARNRFKIITTNRLCIRAKFAKAEFL